MFTISADEWENLSPSMRREWIEIRIGRRPYDVIESPSMRREWIEIMS